MDVIYMDVSVYFYFQNLPKDAFRTDAIFYEIIDRIRNASEGTRLEEALLTLSEHLIVNHICGNEELSRYLIVLREFAKKNVNFDIQGYEGVTLLHDIIKLSPEGEPEDPEDPILEIVEFLIGQGVRLDVKECGEYTPLDTALDLKRFDIARLLIESGCKCEEEIRSQIIPMKEPSE
jgi:hypothetical protein